MFRGPLGWFKGLAEQQAVHPAAARVHWLAAMKLVEHRLADAPSSGELIAWKGRLLAVLGETVESEKTLQLAWEMSGSKGGIDRWNDEALIGHVEQMLDEMEAACRTKPDALWAASLRLSPWFDPFRGYARFQALRAKLDADPRSNPKAATPNSGPSTLPSVDEKSVAVLAFANLSDDKGNEYFSDGISEELLNVLSKVPGLKVTARTSSFHFKGKDTPIPEIAQQLGVAYVVEGSVRRAGDRVRITAQLIKAADGFHVWSEDFDRSLKDIFAVQDEIAGLIAQNLQLKLESAAAPAGAVNPEAYRLYLLGQFSARQGNQEGAVNGQRYLREALALEPGLAVAWAELAGIYSVETRNGFRPWTEGAAETRVAAQHALQLNPDLPEGLAIMGEIQTLMDWDWPAADATLRHAQALAPGNASIMKAAGRLAVAEGRLTVAISLYQRQVAHDPLAASGYRGLATAYLCADRLKEAEAAVRHAVSLAPDSEFNYYVLAEVLLAQGRIDEALEAARQEKGELWRRYALALVQHAAGQPAESDATVREIIEKHQGDRSGQIAEIYAYRGELDRAFEWLERAYRQPDPEMALIKAEPTLRKLHGDPRWTQWLRKMKLADDQLK
jgi:TolB-like protein/Flp pilus assembly protein TadD